MRLASVLFAALTLASGIIWPIGRADAQTDHIVIDVGSALEQARRNRRVSPPIADRIASAMEAQVPATIRLGADEWIRTPSVPVRVSVSGVYGDWTAECNIALTFQRKRTGDDRHMIQVNSIGGGLTATYEYAKGSQGLAIGNYVASPLSDEPTPFVSGEMILQPDCRSGPPGEEGYDTPPLIRQYQRQSQACVLAIEAMGHNALSRELPLPAECVELTYLAQSYSSRTGLNEDTLATLQRCAPAIAGGLGDERLIDPTCAREVETIGKQVSGGLGLCDLAGSTSATLHVLDPDPYAFKATYTLSHQRADCKTFTVNAYINVPKPEFSFIAAHPQEDECLVVEPVGPKLRLFFNRTIRERRLKEVLRLRTEHRGSEEIVPVDITQLSPGAIEVEPVGPLTPSALYWLEIRDGEDGILSEQGDFIETIPGLRRIDDDFVKLMQFHAAPFSERMTLERVPKLQAGVYQVSRDEPLILRRPTATRVWFDWETPDNRTSRFAQTFCARVEVKSVETEEQLAPPVNFDFRPTKSYLAEEKRQGKDTANVFNWRPRKAEPAIEVSVRPRLYWSGGAEHGDLPPELKLARPAAFQPDDPASLTLIYGYLSVFDFLGEMPAEMEAQMQRNMLNVRTYLWQNFPIEKTTARYVGRVTLPDLGMTEDPKKLPQTETQYIFQTATTYFGRDHCRASHRVCILFLPPMQRIHEDRSKREYGRAIRASAAIFSAEIDTMDGAYSLHADGAGIAHEIGHSFGLVHLPFRVAGKEDYREYLKEGGTFPGIDGMRMHLSGQGGRIKSSETGNSEDANFLAPLMYPTIVGEQRQFVTNRNYRLLIRSIYNPGTSAEGFGSGTLGPQTPWETVTYETIRGDLKRSQVSFFGEGGGDDDEYQEPRPSLVLGRQDAGAGQARPAIMLPLLARFGPDGIEMTAAGTPELHSVAIEDNYRRATGDTFTLRLGWPDGRSREESFTVPRSTQLRSVLVDLFLPVEDELPSGYVLFDAKGEVAVRHDFDLVPDELPGLGMETLPDGTARLYWNETAPVRVRVDFLPDDDFQPVPIGLKATVGEFRFDPAELGRQGKGRMSLTFLNGLAARTFELPVVLKSPFIVKTQASEGEPLQPDVILTFNRALDADLPGFVLETASGERLPLSASSQSDQLILYPPQPLEPCQPYRIFADGPIRDHTGQAMQGRFERQLDVPGEECARSSSEGARLIQTSSGGKYEFEGQATIVEDGTVRLEFDRLTLFLQFPPGNETDLVLARTERGPGRRDLTLSYSVDGSSSGHASILRNWEAISGQFHAVVNGSTLDGSFTVRN